MHQLTSIGKWRLKVRVKWDTNRGTWDGQKYPTTADSRADTYGESEWDDFQVGSEATNYQLRIGNQLSKNNWEGDPFHSRNLDGMQFTTQDRDHDRWSGVNCASLTNGGWWYNNCYWICLTCNRPYFAIHDGIKTRLPSLAEMWIKKV